MEMTDLLDDLNEMADYFNIGKIVKEYEFEHRRSISLYKGWESDVSNVLKDQIDYEHMDYGWLAGMHEHYNCGSPLTREYYTLKQRSNIGEINENLKYKLTGIPT